ncbi:MAG: D-aminoacylase [Gemmatimonadota bacterium]
MNIIHSGRFRPARPVILLACLLVSSCAVLPGGGPGQGAGYDVIIEGGRVVDGTGAAWFYGDVAIHGDRIARVAPPGALRGAAAGERVDAHGMVVAPGFIDIQSHSRGAFLSGDGRVLSKVTQGITTEIMGEGTTNAPVNRRTLGASADSPEGRRLLERYGGAGGFGRWLRDMEENGVSPNVGSFVGGSTLRTYGMGTSEGAAPPAALDSMRQALGWAMEDGAFGMATALIYPPAAFAGTDELAAVAEAMAPYGGIYITHLRSEADRLLDAIDEAVEIGRRANVPVEIYHLKAAGTRNYPTAAAAVERIDAARAAGLDVQANMYPYTAGSTGLTSCFPPWASADDALFDNLADPVTRARMRAEIERPTSAWENLCELSGPENVLILGLRNAELRPFEGKRLDEIARMRDVDWIEAAFDLVLEERSRVSTIYFMMAEENVRMQLGQPWMKFGTDAGGQDPRTARGLTHPRAYGTFPRILGRYVRQEGVLELEDAVRKMSSAVATRLGLQERGVLREGMYADVVVFDPETVIDQATYEEPHQVSVGVPHVFVNGVAVVRGGEHTGATPGRVVRGPGWNGR